MALSNAPRRHSINAAGKLRQEKTKANAFAKRTRPRKRYRSAPILTFNSGGSGHNPARRVGQAPQARVPPFFEDHDIRNQIGPEPDDEVPPPSHSDANPCRALVLPGSHHKTGLRVRRRSRAERRGLLYYPNRAEVPSHCCETRGTCVEQPSPSRQRHLRHEERSQ
jgi:hypothetical protein